MGAVSQRTAAEQCTEIEDLLDVIGIEANVFRVVNPGSVEQIISDLRRMISDRKHG